MSSFRTHSSHVSHTPTHSFPLPKSYTPRGLGARERAPARTRAHNNWSLKICQFLPRSHVASSSVEWMEMALHVSLRIPICA